MHTFFSSIVQLVLRHFYSVTSDQWAHALELVKQAETEILGADSGAAKKAFVIDLLKKQWPDLKTAALNLLVELAASSIKVP